MHPPHRLLWLALFIISGVVCSGLWVLVISLIDARDRQWWPLQHALRHVHHLMHYDPSLRVRRGYWLLATAFYASIAGARLSLVMLALGE
jgi:hypothetical protein